MFQDMRDCGASRRHRLNNLSLEQLENLGEALLDFQTMDDLESWLSQ